MDSLPLTFIVVIVVFYLFNEVNSLRECIHDLVHKNSVLEAKVEELSGIGDIQNETVTANTSTIKTIMNTLTQLLVDTKTNLIRTERDLDRVASFNSRMIQQISERIDNLEQLQHSTRMALDEHCDDMHRLESQLSFQIGDIRDTYARIRDVHEWMYSDRIMLFSSIDKYFWPLNKAVKTLRRKSCETNVRTKQQFTEVRQQLAETNKQQECLAIQTANCCDIVAKMGQEIRDNAWGTGMIKNGVSANEIPCFQDVMNEQKQEPCVTNLPVVSCEPVVKTETTWFDMLYPNDLDQSLYHGCIVDELTSDIVVKGRKTNPSWKNAIGVSNL